MKKLLIFITVVLTLALPLWVTAAESDVKLFCDGREVVADVPPQIVNDRMMVPLRAIFEALNATVEWDGATGTVTSVRGETTVRLTIGAPQIYVNGAAKELPVAAQIVQGRTLVPSRAIADAFGVFANWDNTARASVFWSRQDQVKYTYVYDGAGRPLLIDSVLKPLYISRGYFSAKPAAERTEMNAEQIYAKCSSAVFFLEIYDKYNEMIATGSGFFLDKEGTAVTNFHVIESAHTAKVVLPDSSKKYDVSGVYAYSAEEDWAILKVNGTGFNYLPVGGSGTAVGGATIFALGSPLGLQNSISQGLISNPNRVENSISYIQISAPISAGSSGGALLNKYGEVIGITSATYINGQNLNLAIPMTYVPTDGLGVPSPLNSVIGVKKSGVDGVVRFIKNRGQKKDELYYVDSPYYSDYHMCYDGEKLILFRLHETYSFDHLYEVVIHPDGLVQYVYGKYTQVSGAKKLVEYLECGVNPAVYTRQTIITTGEYDYIPYYTDSAKNSLLANAGGWIASILDRMQGIFTHYDTGLTVKDLGFEVFE